MRNPINKGKINALFLICFCLCGAFVDSPAPGSANKGKPDKSRKKPEAWTLAGLLGRTPKRISDKLPLSDQQNKACWKPYLPMWDEFEGDKLDGTKWWDYNPTWKGRAPAPFLKSNVKVENGRLSLTMRKEKVPKDFAAYKDKNGKPLFHDYTAASVKSKKTVCYGYFEVKAKPMPSAGSSSFWFSGRTKTKDRTYRTEIDVFEIGARAEGFRRRYNMNLHVFEVPGDKTHWSIGGRWMTPWNLEDDYHIYGLDWASDYIRYYVDGVLVRWVQNTHWHWPLYMLFDSETMPDWMGMPEDKDLPSTYCIEYIRAWKR